MLPYHVFEQNLTVPENQNWACFVRLRGHNWVHFAHRPIVYCYIEFKLRYLKILKLFSIRVKELFEPIVLQKKKKKKATGFSPF